MLSLIIPSSGRSNDLQITIKSILAQSYQDFEILVILNGSFDCDNSLRIKDNRIQWYVSRLTGVTYARSIGNLLATGDIILQIDDDVSFIDKNCLKKIVNIFENSEIDVLGALELHHQSDTDIFIEKQSGNAKSEKFNYCVNSSIGQLDSFYNLSTGFEKLLNQPQGLYPIQSFRSCFMAYRRSALKKVVNWDVNYCKVGSKMGIREETDFLLRCKNAGFNIYCTNITAIWHRTGKRDKSLISRDKGLKRHFYYAAAHGYMSMKDILETRQFLKIIPWFPFQVFWGSYKNPGVLYIVKANRSLIAASYNLAGFFRGVVFALFRSRHFLTDPFKYIVNYKE